jgi:hypothetical protein
MADLVLIIRQELENRILLIFNYFENNNNPFFECVLRAIKSLFR